METDNVSILNLVLTISLLLFISSVVVVYIKKLYLPHSVILVIIGILLSFIAQNSSFAFLGSLNLSPDLVFYIILPLLIFEGAYNIRLLELVSSYKMIFFLSVAGLLFSSVLISLFLYLLLPLAGISVPIIILLLFGALISATDPIAVLSIFKEVGVPRRLRFLLEGESLFNDGTSFALFQIILVIATTGAFTFNTLILGFSKFIVLILGGILFGVIIGFVFAQIIVKIRNLPTVEVTLTLILAHITFIVAEKFLHLSGIISTVAAAMVIGNYGRYKISPSVRQFMEHFWEYAAFVSNSLIFLLIGFSIKGIHFNEFILPVFIAIVVVLATRFISIMTITPLVNKFSNEDYIPRSWQLILSWGGLRGALPLVMVLLLPEDFQYKHFILILTFSVIFFTLLINATTIKTLLKILKINKLSSTDELEKAGGFLIVSNRVRTKIKKMYLRKHISKQVYRNLDNKYDELHRSSVKKLNSVINENDNLSTSEILLILQKNALGVERKTFITLFDSQQICEYVLLTLLEKVDRQIDRLDRHLPQSGGTRIKFPLLQMKFLMHSYVKNWDVGFVRNFHKKLKKQEATYNYTLYRARKIVTEKVIEETSLLTKGVNNKEYNKAIKLIQEQYNEWNRRSIRKIEEITQKDPELIKKIEFSIANLLSTKMVINGLADIKNKQIIPENVYLDAVDVYDKQHDTDEQVIC